MTTFADALKTQLEADPTLKRRGKRLLAVLNEPDSPRKRQILGRLERHARVEIGAAEGENVDWAGLDWKTILGSLLKLLLALLPLILAA